MTRQDWVLLTILSILWGGSFLFVEVALRGLPPLTIVWFRVALAALVLAGVLAITGGGFPPRKVWPALLVMGLMNNAVPFTAFVVAQGQITGALAAILNATTPLFTVIVAHLATRDERITPAKAVGLGLGFAGVVVMMSGAQVAGDVWAKVLCLGAALSYGIAGVWGRRFRAMGVAPLTTAFGQVASSTLLLLPVWMMVDAPWRLGWPGLPVAGAVGALAVLCTALAYLIFFRILARAGATRLALVTFLIPVSATVLGVLLLDEVLLPQHVAGFGLITLGLFAINRRTRA